MSRIQPALDFIENSFSEDTPEKEISDMCGMSVCYFSRVFKREVGLTFKKAITEKRIKFARRALADERLTVSDVCEMCGYKDISYFSRVFKNHVGVCPSLYRMGIKPQ